MNFFFYYSQHDIPIIVMQTTVFVSTFGGLRGISESVRESQRASRRSQGCFMGSQGVLGGLRYDSGGPRGFQRISGCLWGTSYN